VLLVLDATVGQNAIAQAKQFQEAVGVTGIALTKLDGTAKGGVVIGISDELKIPVTWVGVGEKIVDLRPFDPHEFVEALFEPVPAPGVGTSSSTAAAPAPVHP
jgi:fused signal recognition particle receptor